VKNIYWPAVGLARQVGNELITESVLDRVLSLLEQSRALPTAR
jgi:hypothetical protein